MMASLRSSSFILMSALQMLLVVAQDINGNINKGGQCAGVPGIPGSPGSTGPAGSPGRDGRDGRDGRKGEKGEVGTKGEKGLTGAEGRAGDDGVVGVKGEIGVPGVKGDSGKIGPQGPRGTRGLKGGKGDKGGQSQLNWKQCVWKRDDSKDAGLIQECRFKKIFGSTALHVAYAGTLRVSCSFCCSRWFFTFNDRECSGPMTIEGIVYTLNSNEMPLRHRQIEGYCENISAGEVRVGFHIGQCSGYSVADGHTGWKSVSRIMIAEVSPAQQ